MPFRTVQRELEKAIKRILTGAPAELVQALAEEAEAVRIDCPGLALPALLERAAKAAIERMEERE